MPRYFFEIAYNGTNYAGWQSQANATGVQTVVEHALTKLLRSEIKIVGSGRTDTGVHCTQQFFHADIEKPFKKQDLLHRLNSFLPRDIAIRSIHTVAPDASARYSARERTYEYHITLLKDPMVIGLALHYFKPVNIQTMNKAAALLCGEHDFECFSKVKTDVNHFLCTIKRASWKQAGNTLVFTISANRFLRGMVRAIVGTLLDVGTGKISMNEFKSIINSKDRKKAGANVDPHGLYLVRVNYPKSIFID
ncbi:MAG TPA: tRNA pseudouridine(38-40) synthase TruA [Cyclobacteriaceae bacterium]|nr:tRNA pseudouridine(38-40) synthase TruA [Cyclobacteriaceae bacterium]HRJ80744.1 tRNA pseudouridine(38-40) synthase TruA [Cyclobacteriaceae bacterium]